MPAPGASGLPKRAGIPSRIGKGIPVKGGKSRLPGIPKKGIVAQTESDVEVVTAIAHGFAASPDIMDEAVSMHDSSKVFLSYKVLF